MADQGGADTRAPNKAVLANPHKMMVPFAKFRGFKRADQIWALAGLAFLIILLNVVFYSGT